MKHKPVKTYSFPAPVEPFMLGHSATEINTDKFIEYMLSQIRRNEASHKAHMEAFMSRYNPPYSNNDTVLNVHLNPLPEARKDGITISVRKQVQRWEVRMSWDENEWENFNKRMADDAFLLHLELRRNLPLPTYLALRELFKAEKVV